MNHFLHCSDLTHDAGMEESRGLLSLSATEHAVSQASDYLAFSATKTQRLIRYVQGERLNRKGRFTSTRTDGGRSRRFRPEGSNTAATLLTPTEVRRRFGIVVDQSVTVAYAKNQAEFEREQRSARAFVQRSASRWNDLNNARDAVIIQLFLDPVDWPLRLLKVAARIPEKATRIADSVENAIELTIDILENPVPDSRRPSTNQQGQPSEEPIPVKPKAMPPWARNLEHMSEDERANLLEQLSVGVLDESIPANDQVLLLMRLLDQDNEVNRRPPNSGFAGPVQ